MKSTDSTNVGVRKSKRQINEEAKDYGNDLEEVKILKKTLTQKDKEIQGCQNTIANLEADLATQIEELKERLAKEYDDKEVTLKASFEKDMTESARSLEEKFNAERFKLETSIQELKTTIIDKSNRLTDMPTVKQIIEDFACDLVALSNASSTTAPKPAEMALFRHEGYVNQCIDAINDDRTNRKLTDYNIITFLKAILDKCFQKLLQLNSSDEYNKYLASQLLDSSYNFKYLSTMISSCLQALNPKYVSTAAYLTCINVLSISKSALCADFVNWAMCGGVTSQSIYATFKKLGDIFAKSKAVFPMTYEAIAVFDNNSTDYKRKTWRSGINQNKKSLVWTNIEAYLFAKCKLDDTGQEVSLNQLSNTTCLQNRVDLSPQNWINFSKRTLIRSDNSIINVTNFGDKHIPNRTSVHPNNTLTDEEYVRNEFCNGELFAISLIKDIPKLLTYYPGSTTVQEQQAPNTDSGDYTEDDRMQIKECFSCSTRNPKSSRTCSGCDRKLLGIDEYRQHLTQASIGMILKPPPLRRRRKTYTTLHTLSSNGTSFERNHVSTSNSTLSIPLDNDELFPVNINEDFHINILRELLPSIFVNPSSDKDVQHIYERLGKIFDLVGFTEETDRNKLRYFIFLVSDFGATNLTLLDSNERFFNFIHIIGTFHECKSFLELTMDLVFSVGGDILASLHTFTSEKSQAYLRRCGDTHKANDFLRDVFRPALFISLIFEYLHATVEPNCEPDFKNIDLIEVFNWGEAYANSPNNNDLRWKNFWFLIGFIIPAYELIKKGVRTGNMEAYNAGRRALLPFMFSLSKLNYGPLIIRDMIQYYWKAPPEIRELLCIIFSLYDEGINGKMEEANKAQKSMVLSETKSGIQSGALLCSWSESLRNAMLYLKGNRTGNDVTKNIPERRLPSDLDIDIEKCVEVLMKNRIFKMNRNETTNAQRFDGKDIIKPTKFEHIDMSLLNLYKVGEEKKNEYYNAYIRSTENTLPPNEYVYTFKNYKRVVKSNGDENEVTDDDDDDNTTEIK